MYRATGQVGPVYLPKKYSKTQRYYRTQEAFRVELTGGLIESFRRLVTSTLNPFSHVEESIESPILSYAMNTVDVLSTKQNVGISDHLTLAQIIAQPLPLTEWNFPPIIGQDLQVLDQMFNPELLILQASRSITPPKTLTSSPQVYLRPSQLGFTEISSTTPVSTECTTTILESVCAPPMKRQPTMTPTP